MVTAVLSIVKGEKSWAEKRVHGGQRPEEKENKRKGERRRGRKERSKKKNKKPTENGWISIIFVKFCFDTLTNIPVLSPS